jgi:hypothetical protein
MCMQVTIPYLLFRRLKITHKSRGSYVLILVKEAAANNFLSFHSVTQVQVN